MKYKYLAKDTTGKSVKGLVEAGSPQTAAEAIRKQQLVPLKIFVERSPVNSLGFGTRVGGKEMTSFTRQLATMINAGLPLTDALNLLKIQSGGAMSKVVGDLLNDVQAGTALSDAMAKHPSVFSRVYVALIKAAEAAGVMENVLNRLADNAEKSQEFKMKIIGAMIYPIIILLGMVGVMIIMVVLVIPKMKELYADFNAELPWMTKSLIWISDFSTRFWWLILILVVIIAYLVRSYVATGSGMAKKDRLLFKIPVIGPLALLVSLTEMTRTLALLLGSGVTVLDSLKIVSDSLGNVVLEDELKKISSRVEKGFPMSISFTESESFPPIVGQMVAVGEETGKMDEVLSKLSQYFEVEANEKTKGLTTAIEPLILIVMAVGVGFLMYAVIMPMYVIMDKI